ncbi:MAG: glutathione peroxidase [Bdellovibrionota bacterium]|nr:glutathione peroxidase [Bdellovibrionota bacterium]
MFYDHEAKLNNGERVSMKDYENKVVLIVNTASACGFTPQYEGLERLQKEYASQGFSVLAFPCNQFGAQEPGTDEEIAQFCDLNYKATFPLFQKIDVNGDNTDPLFAFLKSEAKGLLGSEAIKWNFTKFLVDRQGNVVKRYAPQDTPDKIEKELKDYL